MEAIVTLGGIQLLTMIAGIARAKVLAILLGPSGVGIAGVIDQAVAFLAQVGSLSLPFAALRYLSRRRSESRSRFMALHRAFLKALVVASAVTTLLALGVAFWRPELVGEELVGYRGALLIGLLSIPATALVALQRNVLAAIERHRQAALIALIAGVALVATSYAGVKIGGLAGLYLGNLIVNVGLVVAIGLYLRRILARYSTGSPEHVTTLEVLRSEPGLVRFCTVVHFLTLASPAAYLISRVVLISEHGAAATGLLAAAFGIAVAVRTALRQANALYLTPLVNQPTSKVARGAAVADYARVLTVLYLVGVLPLVLFPERWLTILYSSRFSGAAPLLGAFLIAEGLLLMAGVYQALLVGFDDLTSYLTTSVVANGAIIALSFALIPGYGAIGVAVAFIAGNGLVLVLTLLRLLLSHDLERVGGVLGTFVAALGVLVVASWWVTRPLPPGSIVRLLAYAVTAAAFVRLLTRDEKRWILAPFRRLTR